MRGKGWEVTATEYHFEQEIYSWRHEQPGGKSPTLWIARSVLRSYFDGPSGIRTQDLRIMSPLL